MKPTDIGNPEYFHRIIDCQYACPAHTPVPEYIRLIVAGRYADAYMINWEANVFPGVLGRTCDRPCEAACRRTRVEDGQKKEPVAICRLKRVAADFKGEIDQRMPDLLPNNGKRIACVGAGPASLTVARDLAPLGYDVVVYEGEKKAGGFMRSQIPAFRLPESVLEEETGRVLDMGIDFRSGEWVQSLKKLREENYDAIFIGSGAPRGRDLEIPGRKEAAANIHIGIDWLASVSFGHVNAIGKRVIVLGGGNTAMDCCRSSRRLGGENVKAIVRSGFQEMKSSEWEREDAQNEGIEILNYLVPLEFTHDRGKLTGITFEPVRPVYDEKGKRTLIPTGEGWKHFECDDVLIAIGQDNAFPWIERDIGLEFNRGMPVVDPKTMQSTLSGVFFGGDAAFGPKNIITAVAHGHEAAISIDKFCRGEDLSERPKPSVHFTSQRMGIHEWSYDNVVHPDHRHSVPIQVINTALKNITMEVELGFDWQMASEEGKRCLNCDIIAVFDGKLCIECEACADICPMDCITFTKNGEENDLKSRLKAPVLNEIHDIYISEELKTGRILAKDENLCVHCGLCAERCPKESMDMKKLFYMPARAGCDRAGNPAPIDGFRSQVQ